ncbi:hypothetical protein CHELA40_10261 [Chelatococcus asaccharovorans]|nr:hypothetical protein CHELA40_10261 [Chelatococcus asaccharovorans]CAH1686922.1 hypothetical protein CHELA17_65349 [Chelatococcus asaccharovorans]
MLIDHNITPLAVPRDGYAWIGLDDKQDYLAPVRAIGIEIHDAGVSIRWNTPTLTSEHGTSKPPMPFGLASWLSTQSPIRLIRVMTCRPQ